jgi:N-acetylglutamate synthase-like GNAT family acetyltransferase
MMSEVKIRPFESDDAAGVMNLIVGIQRGEYEIDITPDDQPDLSSIAQFYQSAAGNFWVAAAGGEVVGTLGLRDLGNGDLALRKMFVATKYRGEPHRVAQRLLTTALAWAAKKNCRNIFLGTTSRFLAAHRFYEKNGFEQVPPEALPETFPFMAVDTRFYRRAVGAGGVGRGM